MRRAVAPPRVCTTSCPRCAPHAFPVVSVDIFPRNAYPHAIAAQKCTAFCRPCALCFAWLYTTCSRKIVTSNPQLTLLRRCPSPAAHVASPWTYLAPLPSTVSRWTASVHPWTSCPAPRLCWQPGVRAPSSHPAPQSTFPPATLLSSQTPRPTLATSPTSWTVLTTTNGVSLFARAAFEPMVDRQHHFIKRSAMWPLARSDGLPLRF